MKDLEDLENYLRTVRYEIQQFLNEPKADFTGVEYMIYETMEAARACKFYIRMLRNVRHNQEAFNDITDQEKTGQNPDK